MAELFNVVFCGDIAPGSTVAEARQCLREYFKLDEGRLDQLFCGRAVVVKRNLDGVRAGQFRDLLVEMGILAQVRAVGGGAAPARTITPQTSRTSAAATSSGASAVTAPGAVLAVPLAGIIVEPPGADLLRSEERRSPRHREIEVDHLSVDRPGADVLRPHERRKVVELDLDLSHLGIEPLDE